jgi:HlyD family secretion protein
MKMPNFSARSRPNWRRLTLSFLLFVLIGAGVAWWWLQRDDSAAAQYRTAKIERGPLAATVSASGAVNPVTQISVGTQVSGQIRDLLVDFNSEVRAGQLIAQIDPETFEYRVRQAQADVDAARASVLTAQASLLASRAALSRSQVDATEAQRDLERKQSLVERQFIAQIEADRARALVNTTAELVKSAQAQVGVSEAQVQSARAIVAQREAQLSQARVDLSRTRITSPVDGIVIKRAVERGQTVAASLQAPELFVIARNLTDMQVDASIDESDVGRVRTGMRASFTVDAFPGQTFEGAVTQVRKAAQTVANVVTYVAVVQFANTGGRLLPGMTANVRVVTEQRESVLKVPNAALRVRIAGVEPAAPAASAAGGGGAPAGSGVGSKGSERTSSWDWLPQAQAQPAPGGGLANLRERLVAELQLNADQQARLDAVLTEMRPRFGALRDLPEEQRAAARDRLQAEMRQRISALLDAGQQRRYAELQAQAAAARPGGGAGAAPMPRAGAAAGGVAPAPGGRPEAALGAGARPGASTEPPRAAVTPAGASGSRDGAAKSAVAPATPAVPAAPGVAPAGTVAAVPAVGTEIPVPPGGVAPPLAGSSPQVETRNRLVAELKMDTAQAAKLDALYEAARPRFMALRDLPPEERPKARERISADIRAGIAALLSPAQQARYAVLVAEGASRQTTRGRIHLLGEDGKPRAYNVRLGITDGTMTELIVPPESPLAQFVKEGATVITGVIGGAGTAAQRPTAGPRLPF